MKVYYPGPGHETYHPVLGKLVPNEPFELDGATARPYLESGLLKRVEKKKAVQGSELKVQNSEPGTQNL